MNQQDSAQTGAGGQETRQVPVRELNAAYRSAAFGDIVSILMVSPGHKGMPLESLRAVVVPAIASRQFLIAKVKPQGKPDADPVPAGLALWAKVSEEVDQRLRSANGGQLELKPEDWTGGEKLWLIELIAPQSLVPQILNDLENKVAKGAEMNVHIRPQEGEPRIATLQELREKSAPAQS